jgi:molybdopterin converting factor small subunit
MINWKKILKDFAHKCGKDGLDLTNSNHLAWLRESIIKHDDEFRNNIYALNEFIGNLRNGKEIITEDWWSDLGADGQAQYIKDHPKSQKAKEAEEDTQEIPNEVKKIFDGSQKSVSVGLQYMSDEDKQLFDDFKNDFSELNKNPSKELAQKVVEKYGLEVSSNGKKVYMRNINFEARKLLGQNNATKFIKDTIENASGEKLKGGGKGVNVKQEVTTTSKPDLATKRTAAEDSNVQELFSQSPYDRLGSEFHQVFGPVGENGNVLTPSNKHSKTYLEQSIRENNSIRNTIEKLKELEKTENVSPKIRQALEEHQATIEKISKTTKIPSTEAAQAIGDSYAKMAETMSTESPTLAGAMMKNMAEMALYDTELAAGDEVYLPSAGSFPSGDKLKVTRDGGKVERVASVSVKYGKSGKYGSYGFPGETGQYQKYHPNPEYRDRIGSRPGDDGYSMGVKDDIVQSDEKMDKIVEESGMGGAIKDKKKLYGAFRNQIDEMNKLKKEIGYVQNPKGDASKLAKKYKKGKVWTPPEMEDEYKRLRAMPPAWQQLNIVKDKIKAIEDKTRKEIESSLDVDKLSELIGKDNTRTILNHPGAVVSALTFSSTLKTSNGLDVIEHNHQEIKDGKYESHTDTAEDGTIDLKNWKMTWRAYDSRGGGLIGSFNSARKEM